MLQALDINCILINSDQCEAVGGEREREREEKKEEKKNTLKEQNAPVGLKGGFALTVARFESLFVSLLCLFMQGHV